MASYRVLIVEDQREISRLLRSALETLEHDIQVVEAPSGEEAILDASRHRVDLLEGFMREDIRWALSQKGQAA
ncbi:MAG: response regulator [Syntrophobacteraceae bacterium]|nr:response regulator [Syntrophobacteraceae bacterium]